MIKSISYIIKRIIIGVGIALILMAIKGNLLIKTNALTIAVFDSDYNVVGYCSNCTDVQANTSSKLATANRFVITFDNVNISTNQKYNVDVTFQQSATTRTTYVNRLLYVLHQNNNFLQTPANPNLSVSNYADTLLPSNPAQPGVLTQASYSGTFTSDTTGVLRLDIEFQPQTFSYLRVLNNVITYMGTDNSQAISNSTENIVNNNNQNTTNIINNNNQNTQEIIENQNAIAQQQDDNQKVCKVIDNNSININNRYLTSTGSANSSSNFGITDFYSLTGATITPRVGFSTTTSSSLCFYNINKNLISCLSNNSLAVNQNLDIPSNASYVRFSIQKVNNEPQFNYCVNGNQALTDTLTDDNVDNATNEASSFFDNFQSDSHGLSGIITSPLRLITSLASSQCSPLVLPLPFVEQSAILPCMSTVYSQFPTFYSLWQLISTGLIAYYILIKLFGHIKGMQNPNDDRIEVLNL